MRKKHRFPVSPEALVALAAVALTALLSANAGRLSVFFGQISASGVSQTESAAEQTGGAYASGPSPAHSRVVSAPESQTEERPETPPAETGAETYETPADIARMQEEYLEAVSGLTAYGTVYEQFFVNNGATDVLGRVAVRNCTESASPDFEALLAVGAPLEVADPSLPTVLIYHTHTTESYLPADTGSFYQSFATRSNDPDKNIVRVGDAVCEALEARGVGCIHDVRVYDEEYNGAYARSRVSVEEYLRQYPSIKVVLDVHRDAIYYSDTAACKPTAVINGKKAAQIMIITGIEEGPVTDFPDWVLNLRFALALQNKAQSMYEGLMKPIYFCRRKYNMDVAPCALLLEFGSDTNTLEEAVYAGRLLGETLGALIGEYTKNE